MNRPLERRGYKHTGWEYCIVAVFSWHACILHDRTAAVGLLGCVGVFALVDLACMLDVGYGKVRSGEHTVPQRLGTMKSFGSLSVKAMRLCSALAIGAVD